MTHGGGIDRDAAVGTAQRLRALTEGLVEAFVLAESEDREALASLGQALSELAADAASQGESDASALAESAAALAADLAHMGPPGAEGMGERPVLDELASRLGVLQAALKDLDREPGDVGAGRGKAPGSRGAAKGRRAARPGDGTAPAQEASSRPPTSVESDPGLLRDFVTRVHECLASAEAGLLALEEHPRDAAALDEIFRAFHTVKGMAGFMGIADIERLAHEIEAPLARARKGTVNLEAADVESTFEAIDRMRAMAHAVGDDRDQSSTTSPPSPDKPARACSPASQGRPANGRSTQTVGVDSERLDRLLDAIGELVIQESMVSQFPEVRAGASQQLLGHLGQLDKVTRELQEMAMSLRMVPLRLTFQKMARLTRDLAHKAGKEVELVTSGADTELDKAVVDRIADPLLHLVRNAVDHGLEADATERRGAGKSDAGRVELRAFHRAGSIHIEVEDDGRGIDRAAVLAKARERGLVGNGDELAERDLLELVFHAGLSTAEKVTGVSGRGVGMDVVRQTVESLRGYVEITSEQGKGTLFSIRLPLTLAIIDGMVVRVGPERYIIPTLSITRSVRPAPEDLFSVLGRGEMLSLGGEVVPLVRLSRLFEAVSHDGTDPDIDPTQGIVVAVTENGRTSGLVADELVGQQQVVIKSLGESFQGMPGVAGGAIMPDGQVGLIVDVGGLVRLAHS